MRKVYRRMEGRTMKRNNAEAQKNKESFRTAWKSNIRGWKLIWKICPRRVVSSLLYSVVSALGPYVTVWLTARLVDALVSGGNAVMYAIWALACTALTALAVAEPYWPSTSPSK